MKYEKLMAHIEMLKGMLELLRCEFDEADANHSAKQIEVMGSIKKIAKEIETLEKIAARLK